jgi:hypothetical protein
MIDAIRETLDELHVEANTVLAPVVAAALTNAFFSALICESKGAAPGEDAARRAARNVKELYETLVDSVVERSGDDLLF